MEVRFWIKKKIYLNPNGVIWRSFHYEGLPCGDIEDIRKISFEDFIEQVVYPAPNTYSMGKPINNDDMLQMWKMIISDIS